MITLVLKLVVTVPEVFEVEGVIMTKVGPLFLVLLTAIEVCCEFEDVLTEVEEEDAAVVDVVVPDDDDEGDGDDAGSGVGLGEDLNLLSKIESNSANCSMVLEDIDLTATVCCCCGSCFILV